MGLRHEDIGQGSPRGLKTCDDAVDEGLVVDAGLKFLRAIPGHLQRHHGCLDAGVVEHRLLAEIMPHAGILCSAKG